MNIIRVFWIPAFIFAISISPASANSQELINHSIWNRILQQQVHDGLVDYDAIYSDKQELRSYLRSLETVDLVQMDSDAQRLAFWINAYNATVIYRVLEYYPVESVKEISGFFQRLKSKVAGEVLTLDSIEARAQELGDWRVHFALVCASSSCPLLRPEAYMSDRLDEQLADETIEFLGNTRRGLRLEGDMLWVSKMFQWYADDFVPDARGFFSRLNAEKLLNTLQSYLPEGIAFKKGIKLKYMPYEWTLNNVIHEEGNNG